MKQPEEMNKDRSMKIADNELRNVLEKSEVEAVLKWWGRWRTEVGWKRLSRILTTYSKEFKTPYKKEVKEVLTCKKCNSLIEEKLSDNEEFDFMNRCTNSNCEEHKWHHCYESDLLSYYEFKKEKI